jgi:NADH-quinone oxidoreductase subunit G
MPKLTINGTELEVAPGTSVLQACEQLGIEIPRFCFHDRLSVPANCRMCLVEQERAPKPVASCAMPCGDGMVIRTDTETVKKARRGVMEFLLLNHPLDCPICDQGGECDLQDQAVAYGFDRGRYGEEKRAVEDKDFGPLIGTEMTRCILCTRCVRFADEIAGTPVLGAAHRGEHAEIVLQVGESLSSELSGNLVDVCPVGALTSKPYAFTARPWELRKTETVDVLDAVGSNIRVDVRGNEVMRILPRLHEDVNEEWISDKTRFAVDGLKRQRLDRPYVRKNGKLVEADWEEALAVIATQLKGVPGNRIAALAGDLCDVESMLSLRLLMDSLGADSRDCRQDGANYDVSARAGYIFNSTIAGIEKADAILLVGTNPRHEAAILNARIHKRWRAGDLKVANIGPVLEMTYPVQNLGASPTVLQDILTGTSAFSEVLKTAKNPMIILGAGALARADGLAIQALGRRIAEQFGMIREDWCGFNVLQLAASRVGGLDIGFVPKAGGLDTNGILRAASTGGLDVVYLLGADEVTIPAGPFVIYQGHHGDRGAARADVILPGSAYTEKAGTYVNTEGRVQLSRKAVFAPGAAREDWAILRALSEALGKPLPFDTLAQLRRAMLDANPIFIHVDATEPAPWRAVGQDGPVEHKPFALPVQNFYMTDAITRASETMARCTQAFGGAALAVAAE